MCLAPLLHWRWTWGFCQTCNNGWDKLDHLLMVISDSYSVKEVTVSEGIKPGMIALIRVLWSYYLHCILLAHVEKPILEHWHENVRLKWFNNHQLSRNICGPRLKSLLRTMPAFPLLSEVIWYADSRWHRARDTSHGGASTYTVLFSWKIRTRSSKLVSFTIRLYFYFRSVGI